MFSNNHIAVLFDHQYIWKKSMDTSDFLHGNNHQREEVPHLEFIFTDTIGVMPTKIWTSKLYNQMQLLMTPFHGFVCLFYPALFCLYSRI